MGPSDTETIQTSKGPVPNETQSLRASRPIPPGMRKATCLSLYSKDKQAHTCVLLHTSFAFIELFTICEHRVIHWRHIRYNSYQTSNSADKRLIRLFHIPEAPGLSLI
jgi:hypothetical protein